MQGLTPREREVLETIAQGLSARAIASALRISPVTVRNHVRSVLEKLGVHSKAAAVGEAYRRGIIR